jgi:hypothetical protein
LDYDGREESNVIRFQRTELEDFWGRLVTKKFSMKRGSYHRFLLIQSGGWDTKEPSPATPKHFTHLSLRRFLAGAAATPSSCFGRTMPSTNDHSVDANTRIQNNLTRCRDSGCLLQLHNSIKTIMDILNKANITSKLADIIKAYLLNQGQQSMVD